METLETIGMPQSNLARMACEEKNVPYCLVDARPHTPPIDAIHPLGKMPPESAAAFVGLKNLSAYFERPARRPSFLATLPPPFFRNAKLGADRGDREPAIRKRCPGCRLSPEQPGHALWNRLRSEPLTKA